MKKSILSIFAICTLAACKKSETAVVDRSPDTMAVNDNITPATNDSVVVNDSANTNITNAGSNSNLSDQDKMFADTAARGGMMEVMTGQLAADNASDASVKALGQMMVKDHTKASNELKQWASTAGYTLPTNLDADQQKKYNDLKMKKGADFDRMYTDLMVTDHKKVIAAFKKETSAGSDNALKSFAEKTLPTLEHHLMESEKTKASVK